MILPIDDKWRIKSDAYQWMIQQYQGIPDKGKFKGIPQWKSVRYYTSLSKAVHGLAEYELMTSDCTTLASALDCLRDVSERLSMALTPHIAIGDGITDDTVAIQAKQKGE